MPLTPADHTRRQHLVEASQVLRTTAGRPELADEVDYILSGQAVSFVQRLSEDRRGMKTSLSIKLNAFLWDEIAPQLPATILPGFFTEIVEDGFQAFLDGTLDVRPLARQARGSGREKRLTVSPPADLQANVARRCRELREDQTPGRRLFPSSLGALVIYRHFQVGPYAPDGA